MRFVADLHIHSYLSRATSKDLNLSTLHQWAQRKGITVVGTGDFTHPRWFAELRAQLEPAEAGLFRLRDGLARTVQDPVPAACQAPVRFLLSVEVSSIYKHEGKVRKVHNLVYAPDFASAARIATRLSQIGNIESDGRPILGLDSRDLLEIVLESSPDAFLIPAHIWTPWFSVLGAQSGFDAVAECYRDLCHHIFAAETGLSSDPAMNWRLEQLDRLALVSNSDAHSPEKLGREANLFDCELSYYALRDALRDRREGFLGTVEFFPEEGKYHFDGHRKCGVVVAPREAAAAGGLCRACGKRLTGGVASRVEELADRPEGVRPPGAKPFHCLIPLGEVIGEVLDAGPASARVRQVYQRLLERVGPELSVLMRAPVEELSREGPPLFGEALRRMRAGEVQRQPGYDGEYGIIRVFDPEERRQLLAQRCFAFAQPPHPAAGAPEAPSFAACAPAAPTSTPTLPVSGLNPEQARVVEHGEGPLLVVAGPGTGKTRTVAHRIARLVHVRAVSPRAISAITFTRRAAGELRERLAGLLGPDGARVGVYTFHALGLELLRALWRPDFTVLDETARRAAIAAPARVAERISWAKAHLLGPADCEPEVQAAYRAYERVLADAGALDFDDLVGRGVALLESSQPALAWARERCQYLFVDEYQDINAAQYRLVRLCAPAGANLCAVGDPDQAIYGFRGSDPSYFARFVEDYPDALTVTLSRSYRCPSAVVRAASHIIERSPGRHRRPLDPVASHSPPLERFWAASAADEAERIAAEIERAVGGTSLYSIDAGRADGGADAPPLALDEVAVLFRLSAQADAIEEALDRAGIPFHRASDEALTTRPLVAEILARLRSPATASGPHLLADRLAELATALPDPAWRRSVELLATLAVPFGDDTAEFLATVALLHETDLHLSPQKVALLTLHAAKGLEFPLVFIAGCEDGLLPLRLPGLPPADLEEERRLLYVGMTRAQRRLVLASAQRRTVLGRAVENLPCPFLHKLPAALVCELPVRPRRRRTQQLSLL